MMNPIGPGGNRPNVSFYTFYSPPGNIDIFFGMELKGFVFLQFPMGPGPDGPMGGMGAMEPHHMNGSLGETSAFQIANIIYNSKGFDVSNVLPLSAFDYRLR